MKAAGYRRHFSRPFTKKIQGQDMSIFFSTTVPHKLLIESYKKCTHIKCKKRFESNCYLTWRSIVFFLHFINTRYPFIVFGMVYVFASCTNRPPLKTDTAFLIYYQCDMSIQKRSETAF